MKTYSLMLSTVFLFCVTELSAQTEVGSETLNDKHAFTVLETPISVDFEGMPFADVLADLTSQTELQFLVHESARENNLAEDTLITFQLADTRLASVIEFMFYPYQCTYRVQDGIVQIISEDAALDNLNICVINCRTLFGADPAQEGASSAKSKWCVRASIGWRRIYH